MIADAPVRKRERNTKIKADYRRPSEGRKKNIEMREDFSGSLFGFCELEYASIVMALAELGNKNNATVTEASDH